MGMACCLLIETKAAITAFVVFTALRFNTELTATYCH